jgi:hypothetical protein
MPYELHISVRNYAPWQAVKSNDFFEKQVCDVSHVTSFLTWDKVFHLRKSIHHHKDRIKLIRRIF